MDPFEAERQAMLREFKSMIDLASKMRNLLEECRQQNLPMSLAKQIDSVLSEASGYDD